MYREIESAKIGDRPLNVFDDGGDNLYLYGNEFGVTLLIQADIWESAYSIAIDESKTVYHDEIPEAYGFFLMQRCHWSDKDSSAAWSVLSYHDEHGQMISEDVLICNGDRRGLSGTHATKAEALDACLAYIAEHEIDLVDGYQWQANFSGTGIVNTGNSEWLREMTAEEMLQTFEIELVFTKEMAL